MEKKKRSNKKEPWLVSDSSSPPFHCCGPSFIGTAKDSCPLSLSLSPPLVLSFSLCGSSFRGVEQLAEYDPIEKRRRRYIGRIVSESTDPRSWTAQNREHLGPGRWSSVPRYQVQAGKSCVIVVTVHRGHFESGGLGPAAEWKKKIQTKPATFGPKIDHRCFAVYPYVVFWPGVGFRVGQDRAGKVGERLNLVLL